jgi:DnaJ like chaperone protein
MLRDIVNQEEIPLDEVCVQINHSMDYSSRLELLHFLFRISAADNNVQPEEIKIIQQIANGCGIHDHDFESIKAMFVKETGSAYKILELSPDATDDEVKKAYKRMALKYHPDKVAHLGPELQKASQEKFQQLNAAFNEIKKQRGFS